MKRNVKKCVVSVFLCLVLLFVSIVPCFALNYKNSCENCIIIGDVNLDYTLNIFDATMLQLYICECYDALSDYERIACVEFGNKYSRDDGININDVTEMQRYIAEYDSTEPVVIFSPIYKYDSKYGDKLNGDYSVGKYHNDMVQHIATVLSHLGYSPTHICAVLGCMAAESDLDPTAIEGIFDEPYNIYGEKKKAAMASSSDVSVHLPASTRGVGFLGFSGGNKQALLSYASKHDDYHKMDIYGKNENRPYEWYDWQLQLAFMLDPDSGCSNSDWFANDFKNTTYDDLESAVRSFVVNFERPADVDGLCSTAMRYASDFANEYTNWVLPDSSAALYDVLAILNRSRTVWA